MKSSVWETDRTGRHRLDGLYCIRARFKADVLDQSGEWLMGKSNPNPPSDYIMYSLQAIEKEEAFNSWSVSDRGDNVRMRMRLLPRNDKWNFTKKKKEKGFKLFLMIGFIGAWTVSEMDFYETLHSFHTRRRESFNSYWIDTLWLLWRSAFGLGGRETRHWRPVRSSRRSSHTDRMTVRGSQDDSETAR